MIKRTIKETISEYDKDGRLIRQTVTETSENDDTQYFPYTLPPYTAQGTYPRWLADGPTCSCSSDKLETKSE